MADSTSRGKRVVDTFRVFPLPEGVDPMIVEKCNRDWDLFKAESESLELPLEEKTTKFRRSNGSRSKIDRIKNVTISPKKMALRSRKMAETNNSKLEKFSYTESQMDYENSMESGIGTQSISTLRSQDIKKMNKVKNCKKKEFEQSCEKSRRKSLRCNKETDSGFENSSSWINPFENGVDSEESISTKKSTSGREMEINRQKRKKWLETRETDGTWVKCCRKKCGKWRLVFEYEDPTEVPEVWYCRMNIDLEFASCEIPEEIIPPEVSEEILENKYHVGSIVWARLDGHPWLPAIVDNCPDLMIWCQLSGNSLVPKKYHVVFLGLKKRQRAWIPDKDLKSYSKNSRETVVKRTKFRTIDFAPRLDEACNLANEAIKLSIAERLENFGWFVMSPKKGSILLKEVGNKRPNPSATTNQSFSAKNSNFGISGKKDDQEVIIYKIGDIVWAKPTLFPWWPAMIDKCPILGNHYRFLETTKISLEYHVIYFDEKKLTIDWCPKQRLKLFDLHPREQSIKTTKIGKKDFKRDLNDAWKLAREAQRLSLDERLKRFGMIARQSAMYVKPPKILKTNIPEGMAPSIRNERATRSNFSKLITNNLEENSLTSGFNNTFVRSERSQNRENEMTKRTMEPSSMESLSIERSPIGNFSKGVDELCRFFNSQEKLADLFDSSDDIILSGYSLSDETAILKNARKSSIDVNDFFRSLSRMKNINQASVSRQNNKKILSQTTIGSQNCDRKIRSFNSDTSSIIISQPNSPDFRINFSITKSQNFEDLNYLRRESFSKASSVVKVNSFDEKKENYEISNDDDVSSLFSSNPWEIDDFDINEIITPLCNDESNDSSSTSSINVCNNDRSREKEMFVLKKLFS